MQRRRAPCPLCLVAALARLVRRARRRRPSRPPPCADAPLPARPSDDAAQGPRPARSRPAAGSSSCRTARASTAREDARADGSGVAVDRTFTHVVSRATPRSWTRPSSPRCAPTRTSRRVVARRGDHRSRPRRRPRGVRRVFAPRNPISRIDGIDQRVDADVAIVDTGIDKDHPRPQRRRRRQLLDLQPRTPGTTATATGRTSPGIVGAIDNGSGVVGVAPGVRLWAVRILELGRLRPRVVVRLRPRLDHRPARPGRPEPSADRGRQHVGRQDGLGRPQLRPHQPRPDAPGDLPARRVGRHGGRGRRQQQLQRGEPRPRELQRGHHGLGARGQRRHARAAVGGNACYSWGSYDRDDTFANFSNYGRDVDLIAPGKCILVDRARRLRLPRRGPRWPRRT